MHLGLKAYELYVLTGRETGGREAVDSSAAGSHGGSSPEFHRDRATVHRFQIRGHGEREESEGFSFGDSGHG